MSKYSPQKRIAKRSRKSLPSDSIWNVIGLLFLWIVVMATWQRGLSGYFLAFLLLYAVGAVVFGILATSRLMVRYALPLLAITFLVIWLAVGGTYSWQRDLLATPLIVIIVQLIFPESRQWLKRLPARLRARIRLKKRTDRRWHEPTAVARRTAQVETLKRNFLATVWRAWVSARLEHAAAPSVPSETPVRRRLSPVVVTICAFAVWVGLSSLDLFLEDRPLPRNGTVLRPPSMPVQYENLRVGIALSGGGYRAALVHSGVIDALGKLGVPVTNLSSVSGGSIIGSYLSVGGSPTDFLTAVSSGRFRMMRDLMSFQNMMRLPSPALAPGLDVKLWPFFDHFSRLDVQASLIDRVLLNNTKASMQKSHSAPALMVCMTDLTYGISVGAMSEGFLLAGPTTKRFFRAPDTIEFPALKRLADLVAVSGGFPGAFPSLPVSVRITTVSEPISKENRVSELSLLLADGGIRDNLGLKLLEAADEIAREGVTSPSKNGWTGFTPSADWALDLILVSDGGKFFQAESDQGVLAAIMRAIDLSGLETGVVREMRNTNNHPIIVLSALSTVAPSPDASIMGIKQTDERDAYYKYFRPSKFDEDALGKIVALVPDQQAAQAALTKYRLLPTGYIVKLNGLSKLCSAGNVESSVSYDCDWWRLVSLVGKDIWQVAEIFIHTPTLTDSFAPGQAEAVFRFGQYMGLLKSGEIRQALAFAIKNRAQMSQKPP